ncbi:polymorphic toxin-type HINT domain-containing protein [Nocardiopsis sp. CT-R113]|uniref:Polymorphic toxin-type HINT domain-containing protein n=1 Tax=Nocardiopsis codii TaxID=3065942 RepID=A0ABU7KFL2_9ACTN|nr:polymorphic toxin-type HINT domain-containing protein [Nocardiopsis sp. CT-R113]MEE2041021.1 polymorphic toxin-type HINT domain-containing protein [Nocardiopsis sp. CT-R113]
MGVHKGRSSFDGGSCCPGRRRFGVRGVRGLLGGLREDSKDDAVSCASGNSFVRGTRVLMADGSQKPIEDIRIGDLVWASDPETAEEGPRTVLATIVGEGVKTLVEITVDTTTQIDAATLDQADLPDVPSQPGPTVLGDAIIATDGHPFWVPLLGEWVDAVDLVPGMWFLSSEGTLVQVTSTRVWTEPERVHNLTVQDLHTYYVLAETTPVLVHNCGERIYEAGGKHGSVSRGSSRGENSAEPRDGQGSLNNSAQIKPTAPRRVGIDPSNGDPVILDRTREVPCGCTTPGGTNEVYHGHVRTNISTDPGMARAQSVLRRAIKSGLIDRP